MIHRTDTSTEAHAETEGAPLSITPPEVPQPPEAPEPPEAQHAAGHPRAALPDGARRRSGAKPESPPVLGRADAEWSAEHSAELYRVDAWSCGYFGVSERGTVVARPEGPGGLEVDLHEVVAGLRDRGVHTPVLLRLTDILGHRLRSIRNAFALAMDENGYTGGYKAVYPIKVNQQHQLVAEVSRFGHELGFGLEVGSKPELLAVMAMTTPHPDQLIICNGFKDPKYIEAVILSTKLGRRIIPVVENIDEIRLIIAAAKRHDVKPTIGVRVKLATGGAGRWQDSAGSRSKFGLFVSELLDAVELLKTHGMLDCLELLHCHSGSQIQDIRTVKSAVTELTHLYVELRRLGATLTYLDVGGGMGVDYRGDQSNTHSSMNYTLAEYASDVVYRVGNVCDAAKMPHPVIITECGRAMVAYSSVLIFDIVGSTGPSKYDSSPTAVESYAAEREERPQPILDLQDALDTVTTDRLLECYHDALQAREAAMSLFSLGYLSLPMRARAERLFWAACAKIRDLRDEAEAEIEELDELDVILSDVYFANFSLFQSLPDNWAIDHLFPIMPVHRLNDKPSRRAILADITCDSDGKIDRFIDEGGKRQTLDVHPLRPGEPYCLGVFLVGAYQETLGDLHNLFGDVHAVHITSEDGHWIIEEVVRGDTAREVLAYVQYDPERFYTQLARDCERAVRAGRLTGRETQILLRFYESGLNGYTYLEHDAGHAPHRD